MLTNKLLPGELVFKPSLEGVSTSRENVTPISRSGNSLAKNLRNILIITTALASGILYAPDNAQALVATTIIQGGTVETVIGTGGGTQVSPWSPGNTEIGDVGNGTLNISAGGIVNAGSLILGKGAGATGTITLTGASTMTATGIITNFVANTNANITISSGSQLTLTLGADIARLTGSQTNITVSGAGSRWNLSSNVTSLGAAGTAVLLIENGGVVSTIGTVVMAGTSPTSSSAVTVTGAGSQFSNTQMLIGNRAASTPKVNILNGGLITSGVVEIGQQAGSTGTALVSGVNSRWNITSGLVVGEDGNGDMTISEQGQVTASTIQIGNQTSGVGIVRVTGAGSILTGQSLLHVGDRGAGTLVLTNDGQATVGGAGVLLIARLATSTGALAFGAAAGDGPAKVGILNANEILFGAGNGKVLFNHTGTNFSFSTKVTGTGILENLAGTTRLNGDLSAFAGIINANGGTLHIDTAIAGAAALNVNNGGTLSINADLTGSGMISVNSGGILKGSGTLSTINVMSGGTLAPGNSIGTLNIAGNASLAQGSTYSVEINNAGNSDLLSVGGALTINNGASIVFSPENGTDTGITYTDGQVYTIATATGGVTGTFGSISDTFAFLSGALSYNANNVFLTISRDADFITVAQTANQTEVTTAAQALGPGNAVFDALVTLNAPVARNAFDQLSGEIHASAKGIFIEDARYLRKAALTRLIRKASPEGQLWGKFYGGYTSLKGDSNSASAKSRSGGFIAGYDAEIDNWRFGGAAQIGRSNIKLSGLQSSASSTDYGASLYASTGFGKTLFAFGGAYVRHSISTSRSIAFSGLSETLSDDYRASTSQLFGKISHDFTLDTASLTPFAELNYIMQRTDDISETGGAAALSSSSDTTRSTFVTLGVDAVHNFTNTNGLPAKLYGTIGWRHAFQVNNRSNNRFSTGSAFTAQGAENSRNAFIIDAGLGFAVTDNVDIGFGYSGQIGTNGNQAHSAKALISAKF